MSNWKYIWALFLAYSKLCMVYLTTGFGIWFHRKYVFSMWKGVSTPCSLHKAQGFAVRSCQYWTFSSTVQRIWSTELQWARGQQHLQRLWQQSCRMEVSLWDSSKPSHDLDEHQGLPKVHSSVCAALPVLGGAEGTERH